jgi:mono/diheme cytochrome c family protein
MLYTGLKHFHYLLVVLFVLSILIKLILLFVNPTKFQAFRDKVKWPEMIVTILFLVLGIVMIVLKGGQFHQLMWVKLGMILVAIPLTIVGFKKQNKILSLIGVFIFIMTYGVAEMAAKRSKTVKVEVAQEQSGSVEHGKLIYENNCVVCHGAAGDKKLDLAADLTITALNELEIKQMISQGSNKMPAFSNLSETEVEAVKNYVLTLKAK